MTWVLALGIFGAIALKSAIENRSVQDVLRGILNPHPEAGPGEHGFTTDLLAEIVNPVASAVGAGAATSATASAAGGAAAAGAAKGLTTFDGKQVCAWIAAELQAARKNGWTGSVISGYRSAADQARVCATTTNPCAAPGTSNHQGTDYPSCAVDVSDPDGLAAALPKGSRLKYTGASIGDEGHFSSGVNGV